MDESEASCRAPITRLPSGHRGRLRLGTRPAGNRARPTASESGDHPRRTLAQELAGASDAHRGRADPQAASRPAERRRKPSTTLGKGREKDVARKTALSAPHPTASSTPPKPADVQASLEMARPGIEPGTPRFSVVCSTN